MLLGLDRKNEHVWTGRTQITDKCVLYDSRGETTSGCEQDWVSLGDSLEGTLQMPNLRHAIFLLLSSLLQSHILIQRKQCTKTGSDWKTGRESVDQ